MTLTLPGSEARCYVKVSLRWLVSTMEDERIFSAEQIVVHPDLANIIKQYTKATIRKAPVGVDEILEWSSQYFKEKAEEDNKKRLAALKIEGEEDA